VTLANHTGTAVAEAPSARLARRYAPVGQGIGPFVTGIDTGTAFAEAPSARLARRYAPVSQGIGPFVTGIARVPLHPAPVDPMLGFRNQGVQCLP